MKLHRLGFSVLIATLAAGLFLAAPDHVSAQAADQFKPLGPDRSQPTPELFFPNDFEAATAAHPDPAALTLLSLCRRAPFT